MKEVATNPKAPQPLGFTVLRVPFFLEPGYPKSEDFEESNYDRLVRKWGGRAEFEAQKQRHALKERGQEVGITHFKLDRIASNTFASHRLVQWVTKTHGINMAEKLYNELNFCHFEEGKKLNNRALLIDAAQKVGVDPQAAADFLDSTAGTEEIVAAQHMLQAMQIHSIPTFLIGGRLLTSGAVHSKDLTRVFRQIESAGTGAPESAFAEALGIPEDVMEETMVFA
jgi:predicted DsbA family dithiol-disulfide isomerase